MANSDCKRCTKCGNIKPAEFFSKDSAGIMGLYAWCKACVEAHYNANKDKISAQRKAYREANKEVLRAKAVARHIERRASDPIYALARRVGDLLRARLRAGGFTKKSRSHEILGCDWPSFKLHIERQFTKGMSWDRMDEIHIDHITPISTAQTEIEVLALNHFTNLRPMWASENMSKHNKLTHLI